MSLKIATLNLCLGLKNKKYLVKSLLEEKNIDILCMQETEVTDNINIKELSTSKYCLELENNSVKARVGIYITKKLNYIRRTDLEGINSHIVIIDLVESKLRVINIYRSFSPQGGESQHTKFKDQITTVRNAVCEKFIILGDFNLDYSFKNDVNYRYSNMFNDFDSLFDNINLIQMVELPTWSRIINNVLRESILDHIYVKDPTIVGGVHSTKPCFGDHLMISIDVNVGKKRLNQHLGGTGDDTQKVCFWVS